MSIRRTKNKIGQGRNVYVKRSPFVSFNLGLGPGRVRRRIGASGFRQQEHHTVWHPRRVEPPLQGPARALRAAVSRGDLQHGHQRVAQDVQHWQTRDGHRHRLLAPQTAARTARPGQPRAQRGDGPVEVPLLLTGACATPARRLHILSSHLSWLHEAQLDSCRAT